MLLTCAEQHGNKGISAAVKQEVEAIIERNKKEPAQRLAEVAAINQVCVVLIKSLLSLELFACDVKFC